ncbi:hypothetical protein BV22DRAFT_1041434 [Leucogyrophana mollusca]|uniref:Uncharacterized protein n=1 Tax=Leucogyrophana mollusca TaxID=85980 RepID=A0ACB8B216_9AGAM|nr:hypothetical protein BV22DRAFT_1041434 [Leucogyrophana mollusca]
MLQRCWSPTWYHSTARKELGIGLAPEEADRGAEPCDGTQEDNPTNAKKASCKESAPASHVLWITAFRKLRPISELPAEEVLRTWWSVVLCHYELWKGGIHHRDISESNLVYYRNAQDVAVGVLNDFDLSSTTEGRQGNERTGTMPFMAIELLDQEGPEGHITRHYRHDAESLVWVLVWVTLHYAHGTRLPRKDRPLEAWQSVQATECSEKKSWFVLLGRRQIVPPPSQQNNWKIAQRCLKVVGTYHIEDDDKPVMTVEEVFKTWLYNLVKDFLD